jgi:hypothetical protein
MKRGRRDIRLCAMALMAETSLLLQRHRCVGAGTARLGAGRTARGEAMTARRDGADGAWRRRGRRAETAHGETARGGSVRRDDADGAGRRRGWRGETAQRDGAETAQRDGAETAWRDGADGARRRRAETARGEMAQTARTACGDGWGETARTARGETARTAREPLAPSPLAGRAAQSMPRCRESRVGGGGDRGACDERERAKSGC